VPTKVRCPVTTLSTDDPMAIAFVTAIRTGDIPAL
jgi:hypothetical protein